MKDYRSLDEFVDDLPRLMDKHGDRLKGQTALFLLQTTDTGRTKYIRLTDGALTLTDTETQTPDCTIHARETSLVDMASGRLHPAKAIFTGRLKVTGNPMPLMALIRLL